ncbi:hypothetical protein [Streptomyces endophytica]|uniref:DUF3995 domain-containing protein n=1 Tax=Streptomyces endophytica TaxID=2991496 RepID=A0ABY6P8G9_9ACTN|nr:hypothetical protein [Streptomyces endophytica]UZJ30091.1 hypothetical protein OJ254_06275 [Streptomyces endophytica]
MTSIRGGAGPKSRQATSAWAYGAFGWLVVSFVWHVWMGVDHRTAMGAQDDVPVWVFLAYDGLIVAMSAVGAVVSLATVRPWGRRLPWWMVAVPLWCGAGLLVVRGVPGLVENITTAAGLTPYGLLGLAEQPADPASGGFWTEMAINTYFFVGAVLMVPLAVRSRRRHRAGQEKSAA